MINKPLTVFGRDALVTYPLLVLIAERRLREQTRARRRLRAKAWLIGLFAKLGLRKETKLDLDMMEYVWKHSVPPFKQIKIVGCHKESPFRKDVGI